jgi:carbamoyltransferase
MITWGISANSHDAALAVFNDQGLEFASHSERFSGLKNDPHLNDEIIDYARQWGEADEIIWYEQPFTKTIRQIYAGQGFNFNENSTRRYLGSYGIHAPVFNISHHHSHAAAGYYSSPFSEATVLCIDSIGEFETLTVWQGKGDQLKKIYSQKFPHSIGLWYSAMTQRIGLKANEDEYILMGMAAYGDSRVYRHQIMHDFFESKTLPIKFKHNLHRGCNWWRTELNDDHNFNIAAGTQWVYETILDNILLWCKQNTNSKNLVIMGGCALNCSANHLAYKYFNDVWIMPNPGDAGSAIGSVLAHKKQRLPMPNMYMGYNIEGDYPVEESISELKKTGIVGVANGRAEFGPRAFGNRSLLADPRGNDIKRRVNDIKQRQSFRPFAPAVLSEHYDDNFEGPANSYMQFTSRCKNPDLYPAIVHYDGTSRVQVVQKDDSGIRRLLERWYEETGCPMLLNTSLNIKGKPIVNNLTNAQEFAIMYNIKVLTKANND